MPSCEDFEIALERRAHDDGLEPELASSLDAHLPGCERCRAYAATEALASGGLASLAEAARAGVDWEAMDRAIRARPRQRHLAVLRAALIGGVCIAIAVAGLPQHSTQAVWILTATVPVVLVRVASVVRETRRIVALTAREDLLSAEREYVARRLRTLRFIRWVALAVVAVLLASAAWGPTASARVAYVAIAAIIAALWAHAWLVTIPSLARQAAELGDRS